ncbi:uncharacterized protein LOC114340056 isoform X1 [Diabrotica virgifera virgifera]|uniref:THAP-type domain-containing protein n=2 Tax=Diabrotica virgifera virgifera TaxID=50390 RepID=A0ABM5IX90_DIAVI|nr:uncharacterized protein LOC114340056 isoform X1 [Diabrotica virgifera virgifera]XP_028146577.2 uncharacterized protein LOC114340056 isoform X1 [Diabrotica virgifera virgifera]
MKPNKWCFVPGCVNTSKNNSGKIFITIPTNLKKKKRWFVAARRDIKKVSIKTKFFCCEDHFILKEDMENYMEYTLSKVAARMKPEVVPHIFTCQTDKKKTILQPSSESRGKKKISDILVESELSTSKSTLPEDIPDHQQPSTLYQAKYQTEAEETLSSPSKVDFGCQANPVQYRTMEIKVTKKEFAEYDHKDNNIENKLSTSIDLQDLKDEPKEDHPAMEMKVEKEEFAEYDYKDNNIENQLPTSIDLQHLKDEPKEDHPAMEIKVEKKEFAEYDHKIMYRINYPHQ